ncbi:MAG: glycosyltransferase family 4 protein [Rhizobiaceae bacterium]|nr:glycosyltransferase family 4 protein [Rhizobiaceae bacterium]
MKTMIETPAFLSRKHATNLTFGYDLPMALIGVWVCAGTDFQTLHDIESDAGLDALMHWWMASGRNEFPGLRQILDIKLIENLHLAPLKSAMACPSEPKLTDLQMLVMRHRPDLQAIFNISTKQGIETFWKWWLSNGQKEYGIGADSLALRQFITLIQGLGHKTAGCDPSVDAMRFATLNQLRPLLVRRHPEIIDLLNTIHFDFLQAESATNPELLSPLMSLIYRHRTDLQRQFDLSTQKGRKELWMWWKDHGQAHYFGQKFKPDSPEIQDNPSKNMPPAAATNNTNTCVAAGPDSHTGNGDISLIGYPRGEFGLGEDIRLLRQSLKAVDVEPTVVKAPWHITAREMIDEQSVEADAAIFDGEVMFYVMPAFDLLTLVNRFGLHAFNAHRKIGFCQWELVKFPEIAKMALELVDEIWCHSEHSATAFRNATDKPVIKVPLPVLVPEISPVSRRMFDLPEEAFIVFSAFDGASSIARKNPLGAIASFQKAFPRATHDNARLIIKAMNISNDSLWRECLRRAALDQRIIIRNEVMDRMDYYRLLRCCDVVLSMHRAEGFGRLMAEAMAMGIPVIGSAYSGNLDFMNENNSWLVSGEQVPVFAGDYAFFQGQTWLEPDVEEAALALQECAQDSEKRARLVAAARTTMAGYSPQKCGERYLELLGRS